MKTFVKVEDIGQLLMVLDEKGGKYFVECYGERFWIAKKLCRKVV